MNLSSPPINRPLRTKMLVQTALMGAILFVAQIVLAFLPNIEVVSLLLILYTTALSPRQAVASVYLFALLEGLVFGFGIWWVMYLYVWPLLVLAAWLMKKNDSLLGWALLSGAFGLFFGALCSIPYVLSGGLAYGVAWWISGIPYDIAHCVGNVAVVLVLYKPLKRLFLLLNNRFRTGRP